MAVEPNIASLPGTGPPGPTDDGYISVALKSTPQDPFCCSGPNKTELGRSQSTCIVWTSVTACHTGTSIVYIHLILAISVLDLRKDRSVGVHRKEGIASINCRYACCSDVLCEHSR